MSRPIVSVSPVWDALPLGDAAGLTDEFTAEVIAYAVRSANLGADTVLRLDDAAFEYARSINREIQPELNAARTISRLYYWCITTWPWLALKSSKHLNYLWDHFPSHVRRRHVCR